MKKEFVRDNKVNQVRKVLSYLTYGKEDHIVR